jgi:anti-sigma factor RsiW
MTHHAGPTTHDAALLSAYLDGDLDRTEQGRLEAQLERCAECRALLADLRAIVAVAPAYRGVAPSRDLWAGIAQGIDRSRAVELPRRKSPRLFTLRQLVAASVVLAAAMSGLVWMTTRGGRSETADSVVATAAAPATHLAGIGPRADSAYDGAVADLEQVLVEGRGRLDTATVRIIEDNLAIIDRALAEARAAIAADPANAYLNGQVAANMRRKLDLLRRTATAIASTES